MPATALSGIVRNRVNTLLYTVQFRDIILAIVVRGVAPMNYFLAKTEPTTYSIDELEREHKTVWDGVTNPQAVRAIRAMRPGDRILIYHSGGAAAIVGWAKVLSAPHDRPEQHSKQTKSAVVEIEYGGRVAPPVTLAEIKASRLFGDWALVRQGRLSTMAVPGDFLDWLRKLRPEAGF